MMNPDGHSHEGGLSVREQIERYRTAFIAVVTMILIAVAVGGYVLSHENLKLPGWFPFLGKSYYTLKAEMQTAQALTPGQGQAVTIAGAKVGEIQSVNLRQGVALVTMRITPKYARFYRDSTLLMRPKTGLQDMVVEVNPGTPQAGRLPGGSTLPLAQTAPNINFDEFLSSLDAETRVYLQELLAGAGEGLKENGKALSATFKRFSPTARLVQEIAAQVEIRHANIARSIHNFRLVMEALGTKDNQLAALINASNAVFATFGKEDHNVQETLHLLPGALTKTRSGLGKLATAASLLGPTLHELHPFASSLASAQHATIRLANATTPIIRDEVRPFARQILPTINEFAPSVEGLANAFPKLATTFAVLNEFFNELANNPGAKQGGFLFFLGWDNHNLNSILSTSDAHGVLGRTLVYFNCEVLPILTGVASINPTVKLIVELLKPPTAAECASHGLTKAKAAAASAARAHTSATTANASATDARAKAAAVQLFRGLEPHLGANAARASEGALASIVGAGG
jgi:phospholipid/cholesterol/gamma-HCH transport system substrate-binding protein